MILETNLLGFGIELESHCHILDGHILITPVEKHHGVDEERQEEVHEYTTNHDQQSLPRRFATELPGLYGLFHLFYIETLIDHSCNLTITS